MLVQGVDAGNLHQRERLLEQRSAGHSTGAVRGLLLCLLANAGREPGRDGSAGRGWRWPHVPVRQ